MAHKKFINDPENITADLMQGVAKIYDRFLEVHGNIVMRKDFLSAPPQVTTMTLGGSGHEPSCLGFTGKGWEQLKVIGDVFAAPGPDTVLEGIKLADKGKGVFLYVGNHAGDVMSAKMAVKKAKKLGIRAEIHIMTDDCSAFDRDQLAQRRNLMCAPTLGKMLGAASEKGYEFEQLHALCDKYMDNVASLAAANRGATHPATDLPISDIPEGEMVIGMGHHGEGAKASIPMMTAKDTIETMLDKISPDIGLNSGDEVLVTLNGSGALTYMELFILYNEIDHYLTNIGVRIHDKLVGEFVTTQEQSGFILSVVRIDKEMKELFDAPCKTAFCTK